MLNLSYHQKTEAKRLGLQAGRVFLEKTIIYGFEFVKVLSGFVHTFIKQAFGR